MVDQIKPCIIGVAQKTWRPTKGYAPHPLVQAAEIAKIAAADCTNESVLSFINELDLVLPLSWKYDDPCSQLAAALSLPDGERKLSGLSGTSPQRFINDAAESIIQGRKRAILVCGAEAFATRKLAKKQQLELGWPAPTRRNAPAFEDPLIPTEITHEVFQAYATFAMLDSARRAHLGIGLEEYRKNEAEMMAKLSTVAAENTAAWFARAYGSDDLFNLDTSNRMIAYPFSRNTMAFMDVDMASAVIVASEDLADELGVPKEKRVYLHGWDYQKEPPYIAQRKDLWRCPSMENAGHNAMAMAGVTINDIQHLDLYSCFPSALNFCKDALEISDTDGRSLTVTGGLPYFGGPGNNYTAHSITAMVQKLRQNDGQFGLTSGIGMHMTNHVFTIFSTNKPDRLVIPKASSGEQQVCVIEERVDGPAIIMAYTVLHEKSGNCALAICELANGHRCYAKCFNEAVLKSMEETEWVGKSVLLSNNKDNINIFG